MEAGKMSALIREGSAAAKTVDEDTQSKYT